MKKKLNPKIVVSLGIALAVIIFAFIFTKQFSVSPSCAASPHDTATDWHRNITSISPPTEAYLFDKKIPLETWEIRERFEREFYYNYSNADQLLLWWKRLARWEPMIDSMMDAAALPRDFKYLMLAESGARNVQSQAKANGYWQ